MALILFLLIFLSTISLGMDNPKNAPADSESSNHQALIDELMSKQWDPVTTAKFNALDSYQKAEALKKDLLSSNLPALFELSLNDKDVKKEQFESATTNYVKFPQANVIDSPELSLFKHSNPILCASVNNAGQFTAIDTTNKTFVSRRDGSICTFAFTGGQIQHVKMLEIENMIQRISKEAICIFNAITDEIDSQIPFENPKKIIPAPNGASLLFQDHSNQVDLFHHPSKEAWTLIPNGTFKLATCLAFDENNINGLIGTHNNLFRIKTVGDKWELAEINQQKPIPDIDCVDVTSNGQFGLVVNCHGFCRISLNDANFSRIGELDTTVTTARIMNDGQGIVTGHLNGAVIIHKVIQDKIDRQALMPYLLDRGNITCLALSPDNKTIIAGSTQGLFVANCRKIYDELSETSTSKLVSLLHVLNNDNYSTMPQEIKEKFNNLKSPAKYKILKKNKIESEEFLCPICSEQVVEILTPCNHEFCNSCLQSWKEKRNTCPICRTSLGNHQ